MSKVLIVGALSGIASELAKIYAEKNPCTLYLCGRQEKGLEELKSLCASKGSTLETIVCDVTRPEDRLSLCRKVESLNEDLDVVILAWGKLSPGIASDLKERDSALADFMNVNLVSFIQLADFFAKYFEKRAKGCLVLFGSVAGDRGRASNYLYGAAKSALATFAGGLEQRLFKKGVRVVCVKPGFVDTAMTAHIAKNFLFASPQKVAMKLFSFLQAGKSGFFYVPWFWQPILMLVRLVPDCLFKRLGQIQE